MEVRGCLGDKNIENGAVAVEIGSRSQTRALVRCPRE